MDVDFGFGAVAERCERDGEVGRDDDVGAPGEQEDDGDIHEDGDGEDASLEWPWVLVDVGDVDVGFVKGGEEGL